MNNKSIFTKSLITLSVAAAMLPYAQAQESYGLEEIVVTAQKKSESIQDAAIAIDASTGDELSRIGVTNANGLNKISPALNIINGGGSNNVFFVRGVGNFAVNAYTDSALAFNVDGVFIGRPTATSASFLDLERVEVLKGPQGTLYGRNATAGAINVLPVKPDLSETFGKVTVGAGNYGSIEASGAINLPLNESWAARLAVGKVDNDGYNDDGTASTDDTSFRAQIFGELSDTVDLRIAVDYSTTEGSGNGPTFLGSYALPVQGPTNNPNNTATYNFIPAPANVSAAHTGGYTAAAAAYYESLITTPAFTNNQAMKQAYVDNTYQGISAELNIDLGFGELVVIPAYRETEIDVLFNTPGFQAVINQENHEQTSIEARLSTSTGPVDWIFGAYYFDETVDGIGIFNQQSLQSTQAYDDSSTESQALFARGTLNISDSLRLVGAVRYTEDTKSFDGEANLFISLCQRDLPAGPFPGAPLIPNCIGSPVIPVGLSVEDTLALIDPADLPAGAPTIGFGPVPYGQVPMDPSNPSAGVSNLLLITPLNIDRVQNEYETTYRFAVEYDVADDSLLYVSYETGYRSGGFSLATGREEYAPEYLDAFTIGSKNRFMNDRLQLNAELFIWDYQDQQASHFGVNSIGQNAFFTENIGQSSIEGLEIDVLFAATENTRLRANVQYLDNTIDEFEYTQQTPNPAVSPISGCDYSPTETLPGGATNWTVDCSGQNGRNSPELSVNLGIEQGFELAGLDGLFSIDARYRDERMVGFDFTAPQLAESVTTADVSLELGSQDGNWSILAYVRNITDEEILSSTQIFGSAGNLVSTTFEPPRTYGVRLNYNF
jgi:iron complex outermembrane receptor protein